MTFRLGVASLGVAGLAYISSPLVAMVSFMTVVGVPVCWRAWVEHTSTKCGIIVPPDND